MNKKELLEKFEQNVLYLKKTVPPDDIYIFAEQTLMATLFFIHKWSETQDGDNIYADPIAAKWLCNILGYIKARNNNEDIMLDLNLKSLDEDSP